MIRKAHITEAPAIRSLINHFAEKGFLLSLSLSEIYDRLRDFFVYVNESAQGAFNVAGVCALHLTWEDLAEIRSLAVHEDYQKRGIGRQLVENCLKEASSLEVKRIFCLTYNQTFFKSLNFRPIDKSDLPHKVWADCLKCPMFPDCNENAVLLEL